MSLRRGSIVAMLPPIVLYRWRYRHELTGKLVTTR